VVADWCIIDLVAENGSLQRIASPNAATHLWQIQKLTPDEGTLPFYCHTCARPRILTSFFSLPRGTDEDSCDVDGSVEYHEVVELINGERVGIKCDLSPEDYNIVMHVLQGHGRVYGTWLFARRSAEQSKYRVRTSFHLLIF